MEAGKKIPYSRQRRYRITSGKSIRKRIPRGLLRGIITGIQYCPSISIQESLQVLKEIPIKSKVKDISKQALQISKSISKKGLSCISNISKEETIQTVPRNGTTSIKKVQEGGRFIQQEIYDKALLEYQQSLLECTDEDEQGESESDLDEDMIEQSGYMDDFGVESEDELEGQ